MTGQPKACAARSPFRREAPAWCVIGWQPVAAAPSRSTMFEPRPCFPLARSPPVSEHGGRTWAEPFLPSAGLLQKANFLLGLLLSLTETFSELPCWWTLSLPSSPFFSPVTGIKICIGVWRLFPTEYSSSFSHYLSGALTPNNWLALLILSWCLLLGGPEQT